MHPSQALEAACSNDADLSQRACIATLAAFAAGHAHAAASEWWRNSCVKRHAAAGGYVFAFFLGLMVSNIDPALTLLIPALSQLADTHWPSCPFEQGRQCDLQPFSLFLQVFPHCSIRYGAAAANLFSPSSFPPSLLSHVFCGWLPPLM
jgi:hypothetical protein